MIIWIVTATLFCPTNLPNIRTEFPRYSEWETEAVAENMASVFRDIGTFDFAHRKSCRFKNIVVYSKRKKCEKEK